MNKKDLDTYYQQFSAIWKTYMSVHDIDVIRDTFMEIQTNDRDVADILGTNRSHAQAALLDIMERVTDISSWEAVRRFVDFSAFEERFRNSDSDTIEFLNFRNLWCRGRFLVSERTPDGRVSHVLWLVEMIDEERRKRERLEEACLSLEEEKRLLEKRTEAAIKIADLHESVFSLLKNMPALAFSKEAGTGKYLACNRLFSEFARRPCPEDIVGLTDYDLFDAETAAHFVAGDRKALSTAEPCAFYEDVRDVSGRMRHFRTTKQKYTDEAGRLCTLGISVDVTELQEARRENVEVREAYEAAHSSGLTYARITRTLSQDYFNLYCVDLETEEYMEYGSRDPEGSEKEEKRGTEFFETSRRAALEKVYEKDLEIFLQSFTREQIIRDVDGQGFFVLTYRIVTEDGPLYVSMKAVRMRDDARHLIIGVSNVDALKRQEAEAERAEEERITFSRINALSGDVICMYIVDPETDHYAMYSAEKAYMSLGTSGKGEDFFGDSRRAIHKVIYLEDLDVFQTMFTRENMMREIAENGIFSLEYRLMLGGEPSYVCLKAAIVEEKGCSRLIVGLLDIDKQVRREQEYLSSLAEARKKANLDALTGVKNKHAYVDLEAQLDRSIEDGSPLEFALLVFDINELKSVNDRYGHQAGDRYIKDACGIICETFKHSPVFRVGGDEFAVIVQGRDYQMLDELIAGLKAENEKNISEGGIVIAFGTARYHRERNVEAIFERADMGMYEYKRNLKKQTRRRPL